MTEQTSAGLRFRQALEVEKTITNHRYSQCLCSNDGETGGLQRLIFRVLVLPTILMVCLI